MTDYKRGTSANIVVGAAAIFINEESNVTIPNRVTTESYKTTLQSDTNWRNVGYTSNGLELSFEPDFGEVKVDQLLDVAKLYKQGMKVTLKTSFAEATLENLLVAIAAKDTDLSGSTLTLKSGDLGDFPIERTLVAVGASIQDVTAPVENSERIYAANRVLSIQNVTVSAKRDAATEFEVTFRLLPDDNGTYGKIIDRTYGPTS